MRDPVLHYFRRGLQPLVALDVAFDVEFNGALEPLPEATPWAA